MCWCTHTCTHDARTPMGADRLRYVNQAFEAPGPLHMAAGGCSCIGARLQTYQLQGLQPPLSPMDDIGVARNLIEHCNFDTAVAELQSISSSTHPGKMARILVNVLQRSCEAAEASGQLSAKAEQLQSLVKQFKIDHQLVKR